MYEQFFGLRDKPFSLTPNPRFVFHSEQYQEVEGQLMYGINNREGLMLVTGQPGTGKTMLCRNLVERLAREKARTALILSPFFAGTELLVALLTEFGVNVPNDGSHNELLDRLKQFLLAQLALGRSCVVIVDEAQLLPPEAFDQIRVLSNLETDEAKLIQIVLIGQPDLLDKIRAPRLAQLEQRVSIRCTLSELDEQGTSLYVQHRLDIAGADGQVRMSPRAIKELYRGSHGVPRLINLIADRALLAGFAGQTRAIEPEHIQKALAALRGEDTQIGANVATAKRGWGRRAAGIAGVAVLALSVAGISLWSRRDSSTPEEALYRRATTASSAIDAERDLGLFVARYPASRRAGDVLLRLAQLELSRGDRTAAIQHLTKLADVVPTGLEHSRAVVLGANARLEAGDTTSACQSISPDLASVSAPDTALAQRLTVVSSLCAERLNPAVTTPTSVIDTAKHVSAPRDTAAAKPSAAPVASTAKRVAPPVAKP